MSGFRLTRPDPVPRGPGLWTLEGQLTSRWSSFPIRMTVFRAQGSRNLLLVSTFPPEPAVLSALARLGEVAVVLAPNAVHCLWGAAMRDACPAAVLAGPPNAAARFRAHRWDVLVHTGADLEELLARSGFAAGEVHAWDTIKSNGWMQELLLLHSPSRSLVVTDLAFNFSQRGQGETPLPGGPLGRLMCATYLPLVGGFREACPTKPVALLLGDADAMLATLQAVMACDFDQVIVAHGDVVPAPGGKAAFEAGAVAFVQDVAAVRRRPGARARQLLLAGAVVAAVAAAALGSAVLAGRAAWQLVGGAAGRSAR